MDYWEGGPGKEKKAKDWVVKAKKKIDKLIGLRLEGMLAARYLRAGGDVRTADRLVNTVCTASKERS